MLLENPSPKYPIAWRLGNSSAREKFALYHVEKGFGHLLYPSVKADGAPSPEALVSGAQAVLHKPRT